jgi:hypothetical protein
MPPGRADRMNTVLQLHLSLIFAAALAAYAVARRNWLAAGLQFVIFLGIGEASVMFFVRRRLRRIQEEAEGFRISLDSVNLDEARSRALAALAVSDRCRSVARAEPVSTTELPPTVSDIISRYSRCVFPAGDVLELGSRDRGFVDVGRTYYGARLLVRELDQGLFESEETDLPTSDLRPDYPSLLHWVAKAVGKLG